MRNTLPPRRIRPPHVHRKRLSLKQWRKCVEIDLVDTPVDDKIARHAKHHQKVETGKEKIVIEDEIKAADRGVHESAGAMNRSRRWKSGFFLQ